MSNNFSQINGLVNLSGSLNLTGSLNINGASSMSISDGTLGLTTGAIVLNSGSYIWVQDTGYITSSYIYTNGLNVSGSLNINGTSYNSATSGTSGTSGSSGTSPANVLLKTAGTWTIPTGSSIQNITVDANQSYSMWVNGNIPNGIITWVATVMIANTNVPVVGNQYGWYYSAGNALVWTSLPDQIVGTEGGISTATYATTTSNVFSFGITNNSGASQIINYGYIKLS